MRGGYIATPDVPVVTLSSVPVGTVLTATQARGAVALGLTGLGREVVVVGDVFTLTGGPLDVPLASLTGAGETALTRDAARHDLRDAQAMLDERYRLYNRAGATGNLAAQAEIKGEITDLLTYMKELRDATDPA